uniref:(northern house mosquito) hypothetical protein n=1 Tax=Culex pipiens TaxID=7175 RepID=A0A8D8BM67_CULPI
MSASFFLYWFRYNDLSVISFIRYNILFELGFYLWFDDKSCRYLRYTSRRCNFGRSERRCIYFANISIVYISDLLFIRLNIHVYRLCGIVRKEGVASLGKFSIL